METRRQQRRNQTQGQRNEDWREIVPIDLVAVVQRMAYTPANFRGLAAVPGLVVAACVAVVAAVEADTVVHAVVLGEAAARSHREEVGEGVDRIADYSALEL